jgi:MerR family copper efflux transcriptional regulator
MKPLTIGNLARRVGISVETVRFYERRSLLERPPRPSSGYRLYSEGAVHRLRFIRRARDLCFTLKEIAQLLVLCDDPAATADDVKRCAEAKSTAVDAEVRRLREIKRTLDRLTATCPGGGPIITCPILEFLKRSGEN